ncbi:hypothetical protein GGR53DRAFT_468935 [Hypoxylon sp. FL1150]|nr:hypothetical protein GGR53DRAFT_468935 [Hypoxylon sp. FL1150]
MGKANVPILDKKVHKLVIMDKDDLVRRIHCKFQDQPPPIQVQRQNSTSKNGAAPQDGAMPNDNLKSNETLAPNDSEALATVNLSRLGFGYNLNRSTGNNQQLYVLA